jgi:hypothetical protein
MVTIFFFLDINDQSRIEKQLTTYRNIKGLFADHVAFLVEFIWFGNTCISKTYCENIKPNDYCFFL